VLISIVLGCMMMVVTTFTHAGGMILSLGMLRRKHTGGWEECSHLRKASAVSFLVLLMFIVTIIETMIWCGLYLLIGALSGFEKAFYFSTVTYTSLGFGDIVLEAPWRLLSSFQAANGVIMFGWTTALIFAAVHRIYFFQYGNKENQLHH
jgi:hypothetical protein